jgi:hypothetical protein
VGEDAGISGADLPDGTTRIFFLMGLDDPNHVESSYEIAVLAHAFLWPLVPTSDARASEIDLIYPFEANQICWRKFEAHPLIACWTGIGAARSALLRWRSLR